MKVQVIPIVGSGRKVMIYPQPFCQFLAITAIPDSLDWFPFVITRVLPSKIDGMILWRPYFLTINRERSYKFSEFNLSFARHVWNTVQDKMPCPYLYFITVVYEFLQIVIMTDQFL